MADFVKSNLEPIEDADLNLKEKIVGGGQESSKEVPLGAAEKEKAQEVSGAEKDAAYGNILSKIKNTQTDNHQVIAQDAADASGKTDAASQLQHLLDLVNMKGVIHAVKVAKHLDDNYVLDTFHDKLVSDELNKALIEKGMIESL